jgi:chromosome partitioning protein
MKQATMRTIAISNIKGGVGKTTTAANLGAELAHKGYRVLMIDMDPQRSLSYAWGEKVAQEGIMEALEERVAAPYVRQCRERVKLIPGSFMLFRQELEMAAARVAYHEALGELLQDIRNSDTTDVVIIDCPPSLGLLHSAAILHADYIITPIHPEPMALEGYKDYRTAVGELGAGKARVLITNFDGRKMIHNNVEDVLRSDLGGVVMQTRIRTNVRLTEAPVSGQPIREYHPGSTGAKDYAQLAEEVLRDLFSTGN